MKSDTARLTLAVIAVGALLISDAAFVPGTAEAHCGQHSDTCANWGGADQYVTSGCSGSNAYDVFDTYDVGFCYHPQAGCAGSNCPCAMDCGNGSESCCDSGYNHDCYTGQRTVDTGWDYCCSHYGNLDCN